jgi:hypothetical protein
MVERQLPKKPLWFTEKSSPPRVPSIGDWLRQLAVAATSFGSHTRFEQGQVTVTATVIASAATSTSSNLSTNAGSQM